MMKDRWRIAITSETLIRLLMKWTRNLVDWGHSTRADFEVWEIPCGIEHSIMDRQMPMFCPTVVSAPPMAVTSGSATRQSS